MNKNDNNDEFIKIIKFKIVYMSSKNTQFDFHEKYIMLNCDVLFLLFTMKSTLKLLWNFLDFHFFNEPIIDQFIDDA